MSPASRPPAPRPASVVKSPSPVRDAPPTKNPGDLQAFGENLPAFPWLFGREAQFLGEIHTGTDDDGLASGNVNPSSAWIGGALGAGECDA